MPEDSGASSDPDFIERVTRAVLERFPDFAAFEAAMGWMPGFFENDVLKADMPRERIADQVVRVLHCERQWLLTGEGEAYKRKAPKAPEQPEALPDAASPIVTTVRPATELRARIHTSLKENPVVEPDRGDNGSGSHSTKAPPRMPVAEWGHTEIITRGDTNKPERRTRPEDVDIFNLTVKSDGGGSQPTPAAPPTADESGDASSGTQVRRSTSADDFVAATFGADPAGDPEPPTRSATQSADDFFSSFTVTPKSPSEKKAEEDAAKARAAAAGGTDPFSMKITPKRPGELGDGVSVPPGGSPGTASISRGSAAGESIVIGAIDIDGMDNADRALLRAQQQQLSMLREPPDLDSHGLEFAMRFKPAKGVASEFYDFIEFDDQRLGIIVFDVAGHVGLNVWGDVTMATRAFRIYSRACRTPRELLIKTNSELVPDLMAESSLTVCISVLDLEERTLTVAQSGHPPLLLYNQYRTPVLEPVKPSGMVLGLVAGSKFDDLLEERVIELKTGDVLLWYTEGVINCENPQGQQLGVDSLGMLLQAEARRSPEEFLDYLYEQLDRWRDGGEQTADCTAIVMKVGMPPGLA